MIARIRPQTGAALAVFAAAAALADTIKLTNRPVFGNVTVTDFRGDRVIFRGVSGQYLRKPLAEVEWLAITGQSALNRAEGAAAAGDWPSAVAGYENALPTAEKPWLRQLVTVRLVAAYDRAGQFDRAVTAYAELLAADSAAATRHAPRHPGPVGSNVNRGARARLEEALVANSTTSASARLRTLLLELLLYEDVAPLPEALVRPREPGITSPESQPGGRPPADSRPTTTRPLGPLGILPLTESRPASQPAAPPQLPADSFLLDSVQAALDAGHSRRAVRLVERAMPYAAPTDVRPWQLLLGRCRIELERLDEAVAGLRPLADDDSDPALASRALYYLGLAYERQRQPDVASALYAEVLGRANASEDARQLARAGLVRLGR